MLGSARSTIPASGGHRRPGRGRRARLPGPGGQAEGASSESSPKASAGPAALPLTRTEAHRWQKWVRYRRRLARKSRQPSVVASYSASHSAPLPKPCWISRTTQVPPSRASTSHSVAKEGPPPAASAANRRGGSRR